ISTWLQALRLMSDPALVDQSRTVAVQADRTATDPGAHQGVGLLWSALGTAELAAMDPARARQSLAAARRHLRDGLCGFDHPARAWQALAEALYGDLLAADELTGTEPACEPVAARLSQLATAHVHAARDEAAAARAALDDCDPADHAEPGGRRRSYDAAADRLIFALASAARARLALCDGDVGAARGFLTRLRYRWMNAD